jgi:hypothetical protein
MVLMARPLTLAGLSVAQVGNWFNACGGTNYRVRQKFLGGRCLHFYSAKREKKSITSFLTKFAIHYITTAAMG